MAGTASGDLGYAVGVHVVRFGIIVAGLELAPLLGITGWYSGLFVNVLCAAFAAGLVSYLGLWRRVGMLVPWRGLTAALLLIVPLAEALSWLLPRGIEDQDPGFALWALSLLLVGFNEELISRGVVLDRLRGTFTPVVAVALTAALFGLQHLSAFVTTDRDPYDVLTNVLVSGCYGFALAAFQVRYAWIWPLMLVHAFADFTTILSADGHSDRYVAATLVVFIAFGLVVLRGRPHEAASDGHPESS